jgi:hypothetical protein
VSAIPTKIDADAILKIMAATKWVSVQAVRRERWAELLNYPTAAGTLACAERSIGPS